MKNLYLNVLSIQKTKSNEKDIEKWISIPENIESLLSKNGIVLEQLSFDNNESVISVVEKTRKNRKWVEFYFSTELFADGKQEDLLIDLTGMFDSCAAITTIKDWDLYLKNCETLCLFKDGEVFYSIKHASSEKSFKWPRYIVSAFEDWINLNVNDDDL
ncbi:hypothetical protein OWE67_004460 [Salmonella enterica subsp. enterica serovar Braenderup]|nr:hypothetical protein [Salmonella enterica subsp. enterica serovar Infantis]EKE6622255.1 hypothetical protein [Salmonella enterica subsp. enterica serovar Braenderup]EKR7594749.1 hypothetical protein [Salmonella enterica]ELU3144740.1 hypothetical protein [Salmonella enterica]